MSGSIDAFEAGELLASLVDKSLVFFDEDTGRYRLLESVRQYARDRLVETGEGETWHNRHLIHFLNLSEEAEPQLMSPDQLVWLERLEIEYDNLRAALAWSLDGDDEAQSGLRMAAALWQYWHVRGHYREGREWLSMLRAMKNSAQNAEACAKAARGEAVLAEGTSEFADARDLYETSHAIWSELGNRRGIALSKLGMGNLAWVQGDLPTARARYEESLTISREIGDLWGVAKTLSNLSNVVADQGHLAFARALSEEAVDIKRKTGNSSGMSNTLINLADILRLQGEFPAARAMTEEALAIAHRLGDKRIIAFAQCLLGRIAFEQDDADAAHTLVSKAIEMWLLLGSQMELSSGLEAFAMLTAKTDPLWAAQIWGKSEQLREEVNAPIFPCDLPDYERRVAAARTELNDDAEFDRAWQKGRALTVEQAISLPAARADS